MLKGYYHLTSNILTQKEHLNVISNNMTNVSTTGYRKDRVIQSDFKEELLARTGNVDKAQSKELGRTSHIVVPKEIPTLHSQGSLEETGRNLDVAIMGEGFFKVMTEQGIRYTRSGSFDLDQEGYLTLSGAGRVLSSENQPMLLATDDVNVTYTGEIVGRDGQSYGTLGIESFRDVNALKKEGNRLFINNDAQNIDTQAKSEIRSEVLERSNVEISEEMVKMMAAQRNIQTTSQVVKMYDQLMARANELGRL